MLLVPSVSDVASTASCGTRSPGLGCGRQPPCCLFWTLSGTKLGSHLAVPKEHLPCAMEKEACGFGLPLCFLEGIHEACVLSDRCVSPWQALRVPPPAPSSYQQNWLRQRLSDTAQDRPPPTLASVQGRAPWSTSNGPRIWVR